MTDFLVDLARFAFFIASASTVGLAIVVVHAYVGVYRTHRRLVAAGEERRWKGLLPLHVALVGTSFLIFVLASVYEVASRSDTDLTWRTPVYFVANMLGSYAMWTILVHARFRKHKIDNRSHLPNRD